MAHSNGIITAPISFGDVNSVLGTAHTDLASLCTDKNINKWARYKPVPKNIINILSQLNADLTWKSTANWWKGNDGKCGITFNTYTTIASARSAITTGLIVWGYSKPNGGSTEQFRLTDFNMYKHDALPPTTQIGASDAQTKAGAELSVIVATSINDGYCLKLNNIGSFDNYYYLAAIFTKSGTLALLHTSSKKVGQYSDGESIEIVIPYNNGNYGYQGKLTAGNTYDCFVVLSSVAYTCATSAQNGTYIPLPQRYSDAGLSPCDVRCLNSSQYASVDATADGRLVNWTINLYGAGNPSSVTVQLIYASSKQPVSGQVLTVNFSSGSVAITGGYQRTNKMNETLTCPDSNIDNYMVEFKYNTIDVRATIKHDISPVE